MHLPDWRGRWLVVYFYPKDNTPGCTLEGQAFSQLSGDFSALGVEILASVVIPIQPLPVPLLKGNHPASPLDTEHDSRAVGVWQKSQLRKEYMGPSARLF